MALTLNNVADAEFRLGRLTSAAVNIRAALEASAKVDARMVVWTCLHTAAWIVEGLGKARDAAVLLVREFAWKKSSARRPPVEDELFARIVASTRESLGADAFAERSSTAAEAFQHGRELTLEEAVACAIAATRDPTRPEEEADDERCGDYGRHEVLIRRNVRFAAPRGVQNCALHTTLAVGQRSDP